MRKLIRSETPDCLKKYRHGLHKWSDVTPPDREIIWRQFEIMQNGFCAYCECLLRSKHIEHFKNRDAYPKNTFEWENLFGSCDDRNRCGHYKDSKYVKPYSVTNILKPDEDNVNKYLLFLTNGHVITKLDLTENDKFKAYETIRVFNLDGDKSIVNRRKKAFKSIECNVKYLYSIYEELEHEDWLILLEDALDGLNDSVTEFKTAMEHAWIYNRLH